MIMDSLNENFYIISLEILKQIDKTIINEINYNSKYESIILAV